MTRSTITVMLWSLVVVAFATPLSTGPKTRTTKRKRATRAAMPATAPRPPKAGAVIVAVYETLLKHEWMFGGQLVEEAGFRSGSVYPALAKLKAARIITVVTKENNTISSGDQKDRRVLYQLTDEGRAVAVNELKRLGRRVPRGPRKNTDATGATPSSDVPDPVRA